MAWVGSVACLRAGGLRLVALVGGAMLGGCAADAVISRASNEFTCPRERVQVVDRQDIAEGLYDVGACGHRARYMCIENDPTYGPGQCVHEPDPPRWDPDPVTVASLPRPDGMGDGRVARLCARGGRTEPADCLKRNDGVWRWNHPTSKTPGGGLGMTNQ